MCLQLIYRTQIQTSSVRGKNWLHQQTLSLENLSWGTGREAARDRRRWSRGEGKKPCWTPGASGWLSRPPPGHHGHLPPSPFRGPSLPGLVSVLEEGRQLSE